VIGHKITYPLACPFTSGIQQSTKLLLDLVFRGKVEANVKYSCVSWRQ
jgi:hypothetical protein